MQQFCTYGSVRGASGNRRPYRDKTLVTAWKVNRDPPNHSPEFQCRWSRSSISSASAGPHVPAA